MHVICPRIAPRFEVRTLNCPIFSSDSDHGKNWGFQRFRTIKRGVLRENHVNNFQTGKRTEDEYVPFWRILKKNANVVT